MHPVLYETIILNQIKTYRGREFQEFGDRLLSKLYPEEYTAVRAGGPWGDLKNDGYCYLNRTFFHFYGTSQHNVYALKSKITADVEGCLNHQQEVKKIVYISNDANLGFIEAHIDALRLKHGIPIESWGPNKLVDLMQPLPVRDLEFILKIPLAETISKQQADIPTDIVYTIEERSVDLYSVKHITSRKRMALILWSIFIFSLFFLYRPLPFGWFLLLVFVLLAAITGLSWYLTMTAETAKGNEYQKGVDFFVKEGDHYKRYRKKSRCTYPNCNGVVYLEKPTDSEKEQYKVIGYCSSSRAHRYSYTKKSTGTPLPAPGIQLQIDITTS